MQTKISRYKDLLKRSTGNKSFISPGGAHIMYGDQKNIYTIEFQENTSAGQKITSLSIIKRKQNYSIEKILQTQLIDLAIGKIINAETCYDQEDSSYRILIHGTTGEQTFVYYEDIGFLEKLSTKIRT